MDYDSIIQTKINKNTYTFQNNETRKHTNMIFKKFIFFINTCKFI